MALDWNEVKAKAARFSAEHARDSYESGQSQTFWNEFFAIFGVDRKQVAVYEQRVKNLPKDKQGFIDLFMPGKLIIEHKSAGLDLRQANNQALNYYEALPEADRPRYILTCDFHNWLLVDLEDGGREWRFTLPELKKHVTAFAFIAGREVRRFKNQKPVNPKASALLAKLHKQLEEDGYSGHRLQLLLVRILFCLFADDTGIWEKDKLLVDLERHTRADGRDLGDFLSRLFQTLNTPDGQNGTENLRQQSLPQHFREYPYVNGRLFEERIDTAEFDNALRDILLDASAFDWGKVSPAIFGGLFEGVIDKVTRRDKGAHYTPEPAIYRVIGPLFLEDLQDEFERLCARKDNAKRDAMLRFHEKLAGLTFFDPACGAGNFLVVAYRELRELEQKVIEEIYFAKGTARGDISLNAAKVARCNVSQFYGIEVDEFPSEIARVALWMTDHIANVNLGELFGRSFARIPLKASPTILHGDALETDWNTVLPADQCDFLFGNPPFSGSKTQGAERSAQVRRVVAGGGKVKTKGTLDYVAAWFVLAARYMAAGKAKSAFVSTNSVTQGEQVAQLWPVVWKEGAEIAWGHQTFVWPGAAAVHCVIVGMTRRSNTPTQKRLFAYPVAKGDPVESSHAHLDAYLKPCSAAHHHLTVRSESKPINGAPPVVIGSKPVDGGYLIFDSTERSRLLQREPDAGKWLRPFIGAKEYLNGGQRWIAALQDAPPHELARLPELNERVRKVKAWRSGEIADKDSKDPTRRRATSTVEKCKLIELPRAFHVTVIPEAPFLVIPENSSGTRGYLPMGWLEPPSIPTNKLRILPNASLWLFGVLTSTMHMAWLRHIGGRIKSDYGYGIETVYNTFPWPDASDVQRAKVEELAQAILDTRALPKNAASSPAILYGEYMPDDLRRVHAALDRAVDALYRPKGFASDLERVEHLFKRYETMVSPSSGAAAANRRTNRRVRRQTGSPTPPPSEELQ